MTPSSMSDDDLELLSAYLDNELTTAERVNLERRLGADPRLRGELDELRVVSTALRSLDPVPLPRSFTLDPAKVARPSPFLPLTWFMQMGSGLAGLALVLLATVQLLAAGAVPMSPAAQMPVPTSAPAAEATAAPAAGMQPMADTERAAATEAPAATMAPAAAQDPAAMSAPAATQDPAAMSAPAPAPTAAPAAGAAESAPAAEPAPAADQAVGTAPAPPDGLGGGGVPGGSAGPAGGVAGGPTSNSPMAPQAQSGAPEGAMGMGGDPSIDATVDAMRQNGSAGGAYPAPKDGPEAAQAAGAGPIAPGVTLALGIALLGLAIGWNVANRRRA